MKVDQILEYFADFDTFSIDTETSSLYPWRDGEILAGMSIKPLGGHSFYFPFHHGEDALPGKHGTLDPHNLPISWFYDIWNFLLGKKNKFIFHNAKFDMAVLFNEGIDLTGEDVYDTVVLMRLVNENEISYELKDIAYRFIDENARKEQNKILSGCITTRCFESKIETYGSYFGLNRELLCVCLRLSAGEF
jgi:DNA polymerase I-like protein with 3'-5' exonuclease and polymerase domains